MRYFNQKLSNITPFDTIYVHEDHRNWFLKQFKEFSEDGIAHPYGLKGFDIHFVKSIPKWRKRWKFPATPFVEYSEADEIWARPLCFGYEIETDEPVIYLMNMSLVFDKFSPFKLLQNKTILY